MRASLVVVFIFGLLPLNSLGCPMSESAKVQKISQILLKPVVRLLSDDTAELSDSYIASLMETLSTQSEAVDATLDRREGSEILAGRIGSEDSLLLQLEYVRPMSGGVHVLSLIHI